MNHSDDSTARTTRRGPALAMSLLFAATALAAVSVGAQDLDPVLPVPEVGFGENDARFEKNDGQYPDHVEYLVHGAGLHAFLTATGATFVLYTPTPLDETGIDVPPTGVTEIGVNADLPDPSLQDGYAVQLAFDGGNPTAPFTPAEQLTTVSHHYAGDPSTWRASVANYATVTQADVWPGIDVKWYSDPEGGLKFDFIVDPGADASDISFHALGAVTHVDTSGNLIMETPLGNLVKEAPYAYQEIDGSTVEVPMTYSVGLDGSVSFEMEGYDTTTPLIIDPIVSASYIGGSRAESYGSLDLDSSDNAYVAGSTHSTDFPTTPGTIGPTANSNAFIAKTSPTGTLLYVTIVGGSDGDVATDIAVDGSGRPHFTGWTWSADYPTTSGAFQETSSTFSVGYMTKLHDDGTLAYSTYVAGTAGQGDMNGIDVDGGHVYVVGQTNDDTFPTTAGAFQEEKLFGHAGVVVKINPAGNGASDLVYSTFLRRESGGSNSVAYDVVVDGGQAIVTGQTAAPEFPASFPSWEHPDDGTGGNWAVFVTKFDTAGSSLEYSVVFGAAGSADRARAIAMHDDGSMFIGGYTQSTDFRGTAPGSWPGGTESGFLVKMVAEPTDATVLEFSRYVGGNGNDYVNDVAAKWDGTPYAVGTTDSTDWPAANAFPGTSQSRPVAFFSSYNAAGGAEASLSIGGSSSDYGRAVEAGSLGDPFVAGISSSNNLPDEFGTKPGAADAFLVRFEGPPGQTYVDGVIPQVYDWTNVVPTMGGLTWKDDGIGLEPNPEFSVGHGPGGVEVATWADVPDTTSGCPATWAPSSWQPSPLRQGVNYINVRVEDCLARTTQVDGAYIIKYDTTLPTSGTTVHFSWTNTVPALPDITWTDGHSGIDSVDYRIDPQPWTPVVSGLGGEPSWMSWTGAPTLDHSYVKQGLNEVEMRVCDYAGNCLLRTPYTFQFDDVEDSITGLEALEGSGGDPIPALTWQDWNEPRFEWDPATSTSPIRGYSYTLDTDPSVVPDGSPDVGDEWVDLSGTPLLDGKWHFKVRAVDEAGNVGPISSLEIWIDATAPSVPTITSSTHTSPGDFYNLTTFTASWSSTDSGGSGIKDYHYEIQAGTMCSTLSGGLTGDTVTDTISATFDEQVLCVMAEDNAGNKGPIGAYLVLTDRVVPTFTSISPAHGSLHNDSYVPIEVFFEDTDGGADATQKTSVDDGLDKVNFTVNGEDMIAKWWADCNDDDPGTLNRTFACGFHLDSDRLYFRPPEPWPTGNVTVNLTIQDTARGPDNNATTSWTFEVDPTWDPTLHAGLCASENPFIWSDGYCDSSGRYHPPPDDAACRDSGAC